MLRELDVLRSPPKKRSHAEAMAERRRLLRADEPQPALPLIVGVGTKASRPLKLTVMSLVELVSNEPVSSCEETDEFQFQALGSMGVAPEVVWRLGRQWPSAQEVVLSSNEVTASSRMVGLVPAGFLTSGPDSPPVFQDNKQRAVLWSHPAKDVAIQSLNSGRLVTAADLCKVASCVLKSY